MALVEGVDHHRVLLEVAALVAVHPVVAVEVEAQAVVVEAVTKSVLRFSRSFFIL